MQESGFRVKKRLGQNFLVAPEYLMRIVEAAELDPQTAVLEIGPGWGSLTQHLLERAGRVVAVEVDRQLVEILQERFAEEEHLRLWAADILKVEMAEVEREMEGFSRRCVVANLPYYITTPIVMKLLESPLSFDTMVIMVQKEVAERMLAPPGNKQYGSLSIAVQYRTTGKVVCKVPPHAFYPPPQVDSMVIRLDRREAPPVQVEDEELFFRLVRSSFASRRKTLLNNLLPLIPQYSRRDVEQLLCDLSIQPERRAETLSMEEFAVLSNRIGDLLK